MAYNQEEISSLQVKIASLEEDLTKSHQESLRHQQLYSQLEKVLLFIYVILLNSLL